MSKISPEAAQRIIARMLEEGQLTEDELLEAGIANDPRIETVAETLHTFLCPAEAHESETMEVLGQAPENVCLFYLESELAEPWKERDHEKWMDRAVALVRDCEGSFDDAEKALRRLQGVVEHLDWLRKKTPTLVKLVLNLCGAES